MNLPQVILGCAVLVGLAGCERPHQIDLRQPSSAELEAALTQLRSIDPGAPTGRWTVTTSIPGVKLEGVDPAAAERLRAMGRAMNTTTRCRTQPFAVDDSAAISIKVNQREGCTLERLTADPGELTYASSCRIGDSTVDETTRITFGPDSFVTVRTTATGYNGERATETLTKQYDGRHVGPCQGDEAAGPSLWSDPR